MRPLKLILALAVLAGILTACSKQSSHSGESGASKERRVHLEVASFIPMSFHLLGDQISFVRDELDKISSGSVKMEIFDPGALVGAMEILDAVHAGKVDAGYGTSGFWMGKIPASPIFSAVPFGPDSAEFTAWLFSGNGMDLYQEMYDQAGFNVKVLVCAMIPPETSGWFRKEITGPEDLKGLKMRFFGLGGQVMQKLGVSVSVLPGGEIFPSLEKGVIDATEYALPSIDSSQGFHKIAKYNYFPGWHQQSTSFELLINKDKWNSLSPTQQAQIELVCRAGVTQSIANSESVQAAAIQENIDNNGVHVRQWSPEMLELFRTTWEEVVEEQAAADPFFKKAWEDLKAFREEYKTWGDRAYLK